MLEPISADSLMLHARRLTQLEGTQAPGMTGTGAPGFGDMFTKFLVDVDKTQKAADDSIKSMAAGESGNIQDVVLKMEQADIAFRLMKEVRGRLLDAYKEIMSSAGG